MKQQIRRNVFETNSSSTHVIAIQKDNILDNPNLGNFRFRDALNSKHELDLQLQSESFGWEHEKYHEDFDKLMYFLMAMCECYNKEQYDEKYNLITKWLEEIHIKVILPEFIDEIHTYESNGKEYSYRRRGFLDYAIDNNKFPSYIDHSEDLYGFIDYILEDKNHFYNFIFGKKSYIETGNDNDPTFLWWSQAGYESFDDLYKDQYALSGHYDDESTYKELKEMYANSEYHKAPKDMIEFYKGN